MLLGFIFFCSVSEISSGALRYSDVMLYFHCRLFPTDLFEMFIDVGHYVRDIAAYQGLQAAVSLYTVREAAPVADPRVDSAGFTLVKSREMCAIMG